MAAAWFEGCRMHEVFRDCLGHLAWADGMLFDDEVECLGGLLTEMQVPVEMQQRVLQHQPELPSTPALRAAFQDSQSRRQLLSAAYRLAHIDNDPGEEEWAVVAHICQALELPLGDWAQLQDYLS